MASGIASILLHLDAARGSAGRLALAHAIADRFRAQVTVLFGVRASTAEPAFAYSAAAALQAAQAHGGANDAERARLLAAYAEHAGQCVWCDVGAPLLADTLVAEAAYADLLVLGAPAEGDDDGAAPSGVSETAILRSGTPALVVPFPHRQETLGERVLIAWDGSAQAARALRAALPFLRGAAQVDVASWSKQPPFAPFSRLDIAAWLRRHGIEARLHHRPPSPHVGAELAALAGELSADLVVMGCYGHGRIREQVFGGATRSMLAMLPAPVLMAH
jgi:nucleotide-binding universal stress UspA family protein